MIIELKPGATQEEIDGVCEAIRESGQRIHLVEPPVIAVAGTGDVSEILKKLRALPAVESARAISAPFKFASREFRNQRTAVAVRSGLEIGGSRFVFAVGPRRVESERELSEIAAAAASAGADLLRAAAFDAHSFTGVEPDRLKLLRAAADSAGLGVVTEVLSEGDISASEPMADMLEIGSGNMQNFALLKVAGRCGKPVLLNRGANSTLLEWLMSAEYIIAHGNRNIVLCEGGIRTFETHTRKTLDLSAVPALNELTHLPVMVDPGAATGRSSLVAPLSKAAAAVGADGIVLEVEQNPEAGALCPREFEQLVLALEPYFQMRRNCRNEGRNLR